MLEVHGKEKRRRSNNPRAFKNVRGNTHATGTTLARSETCARDFVANSLNPLRVGLRRLPVRRRLLLHTVQPGGSGGHLDDGLDLHGEPERQCGHPDGGPGRPTDAVAEGTDQ